LGSDRVSFWDEMRQGFVLEYDPERFSYDQDQAGFPSAMRSDRVSFWDEIRQGFLLG
jgi:hypothetical protein